MADTRICARTTGDTKGRIMKLSDVPVNGIIRLIEQDGDVKGDWANGHITIVVHRHELDPAQHNMEWQYTTIQLEGDNGYRSDIYWQWYNPEVEYLGQGKMSVVITLDS